MLILMLFYLIPIHLSSQDFGSGMIEVNYGIPEVQNVQFPVDETTTWGKVVTMIKKCAFEKLTCSHYSRFEFQCNTKQLPDDVNDAKSIMDDYEMNINGGGDGEFPIIRVIIFDTIIDPISAVVHHSTISWGSYNESDRHLSVTLGSFQLNKEVLEMEFFYTKNAKGSLAIMLRYSRPPLLSFMFQIYTSKFEIGHFTQHLKTCIVQGEENHIYIRYTSSQISVIVNEEYFTITNPNAWLRAVHPDDQHIIRISNTNIVNGLPATIKRFTIGQSGEYLTASPTHAPTPRPTHRPTSSTNYSGFSNHTSAPSRNVSRPLTKKLKALTKKKS